MTNNAQILQFYDTQIVSDIIEKYGIPAKEALNKFLGSETYRMLINPELQMTDFSPVALFDMWENEQITGNPRNSVYIREDA